MGFINLHFLGRNFTTCHFLRLQINNLQLPKYEFIVLQNKTYLNIVIQNIDIDSCQWQLFTEQSRFVKYIYIYF